MSGINKSRMWCGIGYPENMIETWEDDIGDIYQLPYAYCIHDKDKEKDGSPRKIHVHIILVWNNPTTHKHALTVFNQLSRDGSIAFSTCEAVIGARNQYEYLIHNTENAIKKNKYLYPVENRITGNNFDIGIYEQLSVKEKDEITKELCDLIIDNNIMNFRNFYILVRDNLSDDHFRVFKSNSGLFERLIKGNYHDNSTSTDSVKGA